MYAEDGQAGPLLGASSEAIGSVSEALRAGVAFADFLNSPVAAELPGSACGEVLTALGEIQGKLAAAYAAFLRRFDAADAHNADGYGSASAWLAAKGQLTKKDAKTAVREMRRLGERPRLDAAVKDGGIPGRGPWRSRTGRGNCHPGCATRRTASCSKPRSRERP